MSTSDKDAATKVGAAPQTERLSKRSLSFNSTSSVVLERSSQEETLPHSSSTPNLASISKPDQNDVRTQGYGLPKIVIIDDYDSQKQAEMTLDELCAKFDAEFKDDSDMLKMIKVLKANAKARQKEGPFKKTLRALLEAIEKRKHNEQDPTLILSELEAIAALFLLHVSLHSNGDSQQIKQKLDPVLKQAKAMFEEYKDYQHFPSIRETLLDLLRTYQNKVDDAISQIEYLQMCLDDREPILAEQAFQHVRERISTLSRICPSIEWASVISDLHEKIKTQCEGKKTVSGLSREIGCHLNKIVDHLALSTSDEEKTDAIIDELVSVQLVLNVAIGIHHSPISIRDRIEFSQIRSYPAALRQANEERYQMMVKFLLEDERGKKIMLELKEQFGNLIGDANIWYGMVAELEIDIKKKRSDKGDNSLRKIVDSLELLISTLGDRNENDSSAPSCLVTAIQEFLKHKASLCAKQDDIEQALALMNEQLERALELFHNYNNLDFLKKIENELLLLLAQAKFQASVINDATGLLKSLIDLEADKENKRENRKLLNQQLSKDFQDVLLNLSQEDIKAIVRDLIKNLIENVIEGKLDYAKYVKKIDAITNFLQKLNSDSSTKDHDLNQSVIGTMKDLLILRISLLEKPDSAMAQCDKFVDILDKAQKLRDCEEKNLLLSRVREELLGLLKSYPLDEVIIHSSAKKLTTLLCEVATKQRQNALYNMLLPKEENNPVIQALCKIVARELDQSLTQDKDTCDLSSDQKDIDVRKKAVELITELKKVLEKIQHLKHNVRNRDEYKNSNLEACKTIVSILKLCFSQDETRIKSIEAIQKFLVAVSAISSSNKIDLAVLDELRQVCLDLVSKQTSPTTEEILAASTIMQRMLKESLIMAICKQYKLDESVMSQLKDEFLSAEPEKHLFSSEEIEEFSAKIRNKAKEILEISGKEIQKQYYQVEETLKVESEIAEIKAAAKRASELMPIDSSDSIKSTSLTHNEFHSLKDRLVKLDKKKQELEQIQKKLHLKGKEEELEKAKKEFAQKNKSFETEEEKLDEKQELLNFDENGVQKLEIQRKEYSAKIIRDMDSGAFSRNVKALIGDIERITNKHEFLKEPASLIRRWRRTEQDEVLAKFLQKTKNELEVLLLDNSTDTSEKIKLLAQKVEEINAAVNSFFSESRRLSTRLTSKREKTLKNLGNVLRGEELSQEDKKDCLVEFKTSHQGIASVMHYKNNLVNPLQYKENFNKDLKAQKERVASLNEEVVKLEKQVGILEAEITELKAGVDNLEDIPATEMFVEAKEKLQKLISTETAAIQSILVPEVKEKLNSELLALQAQRDRLKPADSPNASPEDLFASIKSYTDTQLKIAQLEAKSSQEVAPPSTTKVTSPSRKKKRSQSKESLRSNQQAPSSDVVCHTELKIAQLEAESSEDTALLSTTPSLKKRGESQSKENLRPNQQASFSGVISHSPRNTRINVVSIPSAYERELERLRLIADNARKSFQADIKTYATSQQNLSDESKKALHGKIQGFFAADAAVLREEEKQSEELIQEALNSPNSRLGKIKREHLAKDAIEAQYLPVSSKPIKAQDLPVSSQTSEVQNSLPSSCGRYMHFKPESNQPTAEAKTFIEKIKNNFTPEAIAASLIGSPGP